jgi:hypothetical protein
MQELQQMGGHWFMHELHVKILPERNLILDLLAQHESYEQSSPEEYEQAHTQWLQQAKK